jgi:formylmethanofuran dehydrogenase subunit C
MAEIILTPVGTIDIMLEADVITPDTFASKSEDEIKNLLVWQGPNQLPLSEFFDVSGNTASSPQETSIIIDGDVTRVKRIGGGMTAGKITINGSAGMHVGSQMNGGEIVVTGDVDSWAGMEMKGGLLHIMGNAKDHVGCAYRGSWHGMTGGTILIDGNAISQLGGGMSGGEIVVAGSVANFCGIRQSAGLIVVKGDAIRCVGAEMSGGTIIVIGHIMNFLPGFEYVDTQSDLAFDNIQCQGDFLKFAGDYAIIARTKGTLYASKNANKGL